MVEEINTKNLHNTLKKLINSIKSGSIRKRCKIRLEDRSEVIDDDFEVIKIVGKDRNKMTIFKRRIVKKK